ncbi:MAG: ABC transporter ATP-binding protein [Methanobacteriota archaeon]|nr:MAG: ABC transporter ATP-binding protein [Euryarchaeota archaeon]TLZ65641.1 MAG: ABC transporter ATP-binding protein [Euryarchaeota archaeon]
MDPFRCPTGDRIRHHFFTSDARHDYHRRSWDVTRSLPRCDHCLCPIQLLPNGSEPARTSARGHRCPRPTHRPLHSHRHRGYRPPLCPLPPEVHRVSARLVARDVRKNFGGVQALRGVSVTVEEGSVIGLIGPNGSGKTTFLNLLAGAEKPTSGTIELNGRRTDGLPVNRVVGLGIAKTYQIPRPFLAMTVRENVAVAAMYGAFHRKPGEARDDAGRLLSLVGMDPQAETVAAELTVQHRKQLELARAIATGARILLLDEVFAGLSADELPRSINLVSKIQKELGFGALVVEHVMRAVLTLSDHVVVIEEGRTIAEGAPQEVVHDPAVIEAYLGTEVARAPT